VRRHIDSPASSPTQQWWGALAAQGLHSVAPLRLTKAEEGARDFTRGGERYPNVLAFARTASGSASRVREEPEIHPVASKGRVVKLKGPTRVVRASASTVWRHRDDRRRDGHASAFGTRARKQLRAFDGRRHLYCAVLSRDGPDLLRGSEAGNWGIAWTREVMAFARGSRFVRISAALAFSAGAAAPLATAVGSAQFVHSWTRSTVSKSSDSAGRSRADRRVSFHSQLHHLANLDHRCAIRIWATASDGTTRSRRFEPPVAMSPARSVSRSRRRAVGSLRECAVSDWWDHPLTQKRLVVGRPGRPHSAVFSGDSRAAIPHRRLAVAHWPD